MRGAALVETQRLMAQSISALAEHIDQSTGYQLIPVKFADLPAPKQGQLACITDYGGPGIPGWGQPVIGGGTIPCLIWYNGTEWTVIGK